ncbi:MAG: hypothetical protein CMI73_04500 [Candidatus Pelagibacter sp.]|nr:hypothetical protein [Candidatus Pelagibacter sp.]OUV86728.1 MAG: hypothetical protein CBC96_04595 [Pelagibacteraceae bacterium TMED136]
MKYIILKIITINYLFLFLICYSFFSTINYTKNISLNMINSKFQYPPSSLKREEKKRWISIFFKIEEIVIINWV